MSYKIHPGIGVARVGNSIEFFVGPETLEIPPVPAGGYRDDEGKLRRQASRFRIFRYDDGDPTVAPVEVTGDPAYSFEWTVTLRTRTGVAVATRIISGPSRVESFPVVPYPDPPGSSYSLGELRTEPEGRLLVLSTTVFWTFGATMTSPRFDGVCDGKVEVQVSEGGTPPVPALSAWVLIAPPDFAPGRQAATTLYDKLYQFYVSNSLFMSPGGPILATPTPSFRRDIFPILRARSRGRARMGEADFPWLADAGARANAANVLIPDPVGTPEPLTMVQDALLTQWVNGIFDDDWPPTDPLPLTPDELDRGAIRHLGDWGYSTPSSTAAHSEAFRLDSASNLLVPTLNWVGDIPACSWMADTERPNPTIIFAEAWANRGFMILDGDDLTYVEHVGKPYILLLTPALDFGDVQAGPGSIGGTKSLPITFEIRADTSPVSFTLSSVPLGLIVLPVTPVPAGETQTVHIWVTYDTSAIVSPLSDDIVVAVGSTAYTIPVTGQTVLFAGTKLALALDCSTSMLEPAGPSLNKLTALKQALRVLLDVAREGDAVAFASFSTNVVDTQPLLVLGPPGDADSDGAPDDTNRRTLFDFAEAMSTVAATSIGDGLDSAVTLLAGVTPGTSYAHEAVIVVTDGKETAPQYIHQVADRITSNTFALGIGTAANVDFSTLQTLTGNRGGVTLLTGDLSSGTGRYALEKCLIQILHGASNEEIILDPPGRITPGGVHKIEIPITEAEQSFKAMVVSDEISLLNLSLETPDGTLLRGTALAGLPGLTVVQGPRIGTIEVALPLLTKLRQHSHAGTWRLHLESRLKRIAEQLTHVSDTNDFGKTITYTAIVSARSALRFRGHLEQKGGLLLLEATAAIFGAPPQGQVRVVADLLGPSGFRAELMLKETSPGHYSNEFRPIARGDYHVRLRAQGHSHAGYPFYRELALVGSLLTPEVPPKVPGDVPSNGKDHSKDPPERCPTNVLHEALAAMLENWASRLRKKC